MVFADIIAFVKAFPQLVSAIEKVGATLNQMYVDKKNSDLDQFKGEVYAELDKIILAKNDDDRKSGIVALSKRIAGKRL
jgi:hypothetical protein